MGSVTVASCTSLPDIDRGTCGNQIVDPNEDCDTYGDTAAKTVCRAPGKTGECRFDCTLSTAGTRPSCPSGWACGLDSICREASGAFTALPAQLKSDATGVGLYDYDGDGLKDIRARDPSAIQIFYSDPGGSNGQSFTIPALDSRPASGLLTTGTANDLALAVNGSIAVWQGLPNRTMVPTAYSSIQIPDNPLRFFVAQSLGPVAPATTIAPGGQILVLGSMFAGVDPSLTAILLKGANNAFVPLFILPVKDSVTNLIGDPLVGSIVEDPVGSPCDEFAMAFANESVVHVYTPCRPNGTGGSALNPVIINKLKVPQLTLPDVGLPVGYVVSGFLLADLNSDGHLDLLIEGAGSAGSAVFAAYGLGNGYFNSTPPMAGAHDGADAGADAAVSPGPHDDMASRDGTASLFTTLPLAVGQLTADTLLDYVYSDSITLRTGLGSFPVSVPGDTPWDEAHILDLNGNGKPDVITASANQIEFFNGTGAQLDHFVYPVNGAASRLSFGDVDGDTVVDIAYREKGDATVGDSLSLLFGKLFTAPEPPISLGRLGEIQDVQSGVLAGIGNGGLADIGVQSKSLDGTSAFISVIVGASDRQLQSPFTLESKANDGTFKEATAVDFVIGKFTSDPRPSLAIVALQKTAAAGGSEYDLWLAPVTGDAQLTQTTLTKSASLDTQDIVAGKNKSMLAQFDWAATIVTAADLDPPGAAEIDEVIMLSPPTYGTKQTTGQLWIANVVNGMFNVTKTIPIGVPAARPSWGLRHADFNHDGNQDLMLLADFADGMKVQVLWNMGNGSLDPQNSTTFALPSGEIPLSFASINADPDPALEIIVLTATGIYLAKLNPEGTAFLPPTLVPGLPGGDTLTAGDVTGDGIDDVIIAGNGVVQVFAGTPVLK